MAFTKITENDTINKGVMGLPDTPNLSTSEMQAKFEELSNDVIIPKLNNLVDELEAKSAAGNIGATIPSGINAESENVQAVLNGIAEKAHTHEKSDAELTDAVTKAHEHSNKSVIDKFTENESGVPLYNGGKMTGDAFKKVKVGDKYITAEDYDTIEIVAGDNVVIDADTEKKTLKISAIGGSGGGGGDMYKAVYDKDNDGMVDNAKTVGSLDNLNTTNQENVVNAINEVISDRQIKTYLSPTLMDSTKNWTNYALKDLKAGRCLMASLSETTDISNAYTNGVIPVQKAGTLKGINVNNNGFYQYFTIDGEQYINSCSNFVANTFTGWNKFDVDTLTTLEQVTASTDVSKPVGAGAVQELNSSLGGLKFGIDKYGNYGYIKAGADSVTPFKSKIVIPVIRVRGGYSVRSILDTFSIDVTGYKTLVIGGITVNTNASTTLTVSGNVSVGKTITGATTIDISDDSIINFYISLDNNGGSGYFANASFDNVEIY